MASEIIRNRTPEERELEKKKAEFASLEAELIQRELDLATLRAELRDFESRYLRTVGVLYAELDEILFAGIHQIVYGYHRCLSKRFPFAIYYDVEGELIRVYAVLDCRRNPSWTRKRLKRSG